MPSNYGEQMGAIPYNPEPYPYPVAQPTVTYPTAQPSIIDYSISNYVPVPPSPVREYFIQVTDDISLNVRADRMSSDYDTGAFTFYKGDRKVASFMRWIYYVELETEFESTEQE